MMKKENLKKPLACDQKWDEMTPTGKGRLCHGCGKLVLDFRNYSWKNISKVHSNSSIPVCGIYSEDQLNSWGQEVNSKPCSKLLVISATLLALTQVTPATIQAQVTQQQPVNSSPSQNKPAVKRPTKKIISGTVVALLLPDSTKRPLQDVFITVLQDSLQLKTKTDSIGRFEIDITTKFAKLPHDLTLVISYPDTQDKSLVIDKNKLETLEITLLEERLISLPSETTYFYAVAPVTDTLDNSKTVQKKWWHWKRKGR